MALLKTMLRLLLLPLIGQALRDESRDPETDEHLRDYGVPGHWLGAFTGEDGKEEIIHVIGGFGMNPQVKVLFANLTCDEPRTPVALKIVKTHRRWPGPMPNMVRSEVTIMKSLKPHPNVIRFFGVTLADKYIYNEDGDSLQEIVKGADRTLEDIGDHGDRTVMAMEYAAGGSLTSEKIASLTLPSRLRIFRDVVKGLASLHDQGIRHGDLKPEQVVLTAEDCEDPSCVAKVCDFGSACLVDELQKNEEERTTECGKCTAEFEAPEMWKDGGEENDYMPLYPKSLQNDHWALGAILYEMVMKVALLQAPSWAKYKNFEEESMQVSEDTLNISTKIAGRIVSDLSLDVALNLVSADNAKDIGAIVGDIVAGLLHKNPESRMNLAVVQAKLTNALEKLKVPANMQENVHVPSCFQACISNEPKCEHSCSFSTPGNRASLSCK